MDRICELNNRACILLREDKHEQALECLVAAMADTNNLTAMASNDNMDCTAANNADFQSTAPPAFSLSVDFMLIADGDGSATATTSTSTSLLSSPPSTNWHLPLFLKGEFLQPSWVSSWTAPTAQANSSATAQTLSFVLVYNISLVLQHLTRHPTVCNNPLLRLPIAERSLNMYYHAQSLLLAIFADDTASPSASTASISSSSMFAMPKTGICTTLLLNVGEVNRMMGHIEQAETCFEHAVHLLICARDAAADNDAPMCTKEEAMHQFCERVLDATMRQNSAPAA